MLIYIGTTNTTTGNPRRGWLRTTASGQPLGWIEEGYEGRGAIAGYDDGESVKITVTPKEYKRIKSMGENAEKENNFCLDCGTATLKVMTMADGSTVGVGINRLSCDEGWRCGDCAGVECDTCGKNIYLDEDFTLVDENGINSSHHYECLTPEQKEEANK